MSIIRRFILNVGTSWLAMLVRVGANILLLPYLVDKIGGSSFGVWRTVTAFLICTSLLDFGLGMAIRRYAARFAALKSDEDQQRLISTATAIYAGAGLLALLAAIVLAPFSPSFFKDIPPSLADQTVQLFYLVGAIAFLRLLATPFMGFLQGLQFIHTTNAANIASNVLRLAGTIAVMELLNPQVVLVGWVTLAGEFVGTLIVVAGCFRAWPGLRIGLRHFSRSHLHQIAGFAANAFIITIAGLVLYQAPNFIISKAISAAAVTLYAAGALISMTLREMVGALAAVLMPMFSESDALENRQVLETRLWQGSLLGNAITWMVIVGALIYAEPLIAQWLGRDMMASYWPLVIMVAGETSAGFDAAAASALAGYGHMKYLMITRVMTSVVGLSGAVVAVEYLDGGITGVALAVTVPNTIRGFWLAWYCSHRLEVPFWPYVWRSTARPLAATTILVAVCLVLGWLYPVTSRVDLAVTVLILGLGAAVIGIGVALPSAMRRRLVGATLAKLKA